MRTIGIVGAGTMGGGIAYVAALAGFNALLFDVKPEIVTQALQRISTDATKGAERGKLTSDQASQIIANIRQCSSLQEFSSCDIVIEAIIELLDAKKSLFQQFESICRTETVLASNTSSLSITAIAAGSQHPERIVGLHFFNPPHLMKLVEVVNGHQTSKSTTELTTQFAKALGKIPVLTKDTPGFIVNRVARPFYGEALRILGEGIASTEDIDRIVKLEGGFKMGPFELMDLIGIDINLAVTKSMYEQTFGEPRYRPHIIQQTMVNAGMLGKKTKRGFYSYPS
jgi:3-hydroxybutyryl-CoA dehydrogenase